MQARLTGDHKSRPWYGTTFVKSKVISQSRRSDPESVIVSKKGCQPKHRLTTSQPGIRGLQGCYRSLAEHTVANFRHRTLFPESRIELARCLQVEQPEEIRPFLKGVDVCASAAPYRLNLALAREAVVSGVSFCDLGGNADIVWLNRWDRGMFRSGQFPRNWPSHRRKWSASWRSATFK